MAVAFCTDLIDNGTPESAVMRIAGWKPDMLGRRYYNRDAKKAWLPLRFSRGERTLAADTEIFWKPQ